jgi:L-rhamnonate dehydratase
VSSAFKIKDVRVSTLKPGAAGGAYFKPGEVGHWLVDSLIANPMSGHAQSREGRAGASAFWGLSPLKSKPKMA